MASSILNDGDDGLENCYNRKWVQREKIKTCRL